MVEPTVDSFSVHEPLSCLGVGLRALSRASLTPNQAVRSVSRTYRIRGLLVLSLVFITGAPAEERVGSLISFSSSFLSTLYSLVVLHKSKETISPTQSTRNKTVHPPPKTCNVTYGLNGFFERMCCVRHSPGLYGWGSEQN